VIAIAAILLSATVLTHDIEAKKHKKHKKCETYSDGSRSCIGDTVKYWDSHGNMHKCKVVTLKGNDKCNLPKDVDQGQFWQTANAQSIEQDSKQTLDQEVNNVILECSHGYNLKFCDKLLSVIDKECRDNYHFYCFGKVWESLEQ